MMAKMEVGIFNPNIALGCGPGAGSSFVTEPPKDINDMGGEDGMDSLHQDDGDAAEISQYTENPLHDTSYSRPPLPPSREQSMVGDDTISYAL